MISNGLQDLTSRQQSGRSLEREFYLDPAIWALDVEHVLSSKWHQVADSLRRIAFLKGKNEARAAGAANLSVLSKADAFRLVAH